MKMSHFQFKWITLEHSYANLAGVDQLEFDEIKEIVSDIKLEEEVIFVEDAMVKDDVLEDVTVKENRTFEPVDMLDVSSYPAGHSGRVLSPEERSGGEADCKEDKLVPVVVVNNYTIPNDVFLKYQNSCEKSQAGTADLGKTFTQDTSTLFERHTFKLMEESRLLNLEKNLSQNHNQATSLKLQKLLEELAAVRNECDKQVQDITIKLITKEAEAIKLKEELTSFKRMKEVDDLRISAHQEKIKEYERKCSVLESTLKTVTADFHKLKSDLTQTRQEKITKDNGKMKEMKHALSLKELECKFLKDEVYRLNKLMLGKECDKNKGHQVRKRKRKNVNNASVNSANTSSYHSVGDSNLLEDA